jgi:hypothetical protein
MVCPASQGVIRDEFGERCLEDARAEPVEVIRRRIVAGEERGELDSQRRVALPLEERGACREWEGERPLKELAKPLAIHGPSAISRALALHRTCVPSVSPAKGRKNIRVGRFALNTPSGIAPGISR